MPRYAAGLGIGGLVELQVLGVVGCLLLRLLVVIGHDARGEKTGGDFRWGRVA